MAPFHRFPLAYVFLFLSACRLVGQEVPERLKTGYQPLDERLSKMVRVDEHAISAQEAATLDRPIFLDARQLDEYRSSHLPNAVHIGFDDPDWSVLDALDPLRPVVVYCTIGFRSQRIADQLRTRRQAPVYNLFGSIYAWKLEGYALTDRNGTTDTIHTYNRKWGTYFPDSLATKVY